MTMPLPMVEIIDRKRRGVTLSAGELGAVVAGFTAGRIPDYQMAALLMAIVWRGLTDAETLALTEAMADSGQRLDLSDIAPVVADKHSTGGVGDKTTLVVAPLVAACGLPVGKMTGRGLGHTGGTVDKLESIAGMEMALDAERFRTILRRHRLVLAGQSAELAPADGVIYALRDVTATVESIPLIASSIMSKKLAAGATAILLDVKVGRGAFMEDLEAARALATLMVSIGRRAGRRTRAVLSAMEQPLGRAVGNALEVAEAVAVLQGGGPDDLVTLCCHEAAELLVVGGFEDDQATAERRVEAVRRDGRALALLAAVVAAQGGDARQIEEPARLPQAPVRIMLPSPVDGWVGAIDARAIGRLVMRLGGGRQRKGDSIDHRVGLRLLAKIGERVEAGAPLLEVHAASAPIVPELAPELLAAYQFVAARPPAAPLLLGSVG